MRLEFDDPRAAIDQRMLEDRFDYADALAAEQRRISDETAALVRMCDMDARCEHLPTVGDYRNMSASGYVPQRLQTLGEVLYEALDSTKRPDHDSVMTLICRAAQGQNIHADAAALLRTLCDRIGEQHAEVV